MPMHAWDFLVALLTGGRDLEALVLDQLLDPIGDVEVLRRVLEPHVPGLEVAVVRQGVAGSVLVVKIPLEHVWSLQPQLPYLAHLHFVALWIDVLGRQVREHLADAADGAIPFVPRLGVRHGARLAEAVGLVDAEVQTAVDGVDELAGQRGGAGGDHAEGGEVEGFDERVAGEAHEDGRRDVDEGDVVVLDGAAEGLEVEDRHDEELDAAVQRLVHEPGEAVDVVEGQDAEDLVTVLARVPLPHAPVDHQDVGDDVAMREHDAFGEAGRAAAVDEEREIFVGIHSPPAVSSCAGNLADAGEVLGFSGWVALVTDQDDAVEGDV